MDRSWEGEVKRQEPEARQTQTSFPIVGIGASAGGLEAFQAFFEAMPADSGMAFVLVQHLDPTHHSHGAELLARHTRMKVLEVEDGMRVEPNHVYFIMPNRTLTLERDLLRLRKPKEPRGRRRPVDAFFCSLAEEKREKAIGIILSGTGSNGTAGVRMVRAEGGLTIAQEPENARFDGMPRSAINSGAIDYILSAEKMPQLLVNYAKHSYLKVDEEPHTAGTEASHQLHSLLRMLHGRSGRDFRDYRQSTLLRRIQRRMAIHQCETMADYAELLRNADEVEALIKDLRITVTEFFRDPEAWKVLEEKAIAPLVKSREAGSSLRIWVPACSTGEEAYSVAILLVEQAQAARKELEIQIYATDIAEDALRSAREGLFPGAALKGMSSERLQLFFDKVGDDDHYRISQKIRGLVAFAPQDLLRDPPFSRLDLICCRNLLIYLEPEAQKRVISLLHFALREDGFVFLGRTESTDGQEGLFQPISKKWRIYRRVGPTRQDRVSFLVAGREAKYSPQELSLRRSVAGISADLAKEVLADRYAPASVLIDRKYQILYFHGSTEPYLSQPAGEPTRDLLSLARRGLSAKLQVALQTAFQESRPVTVNGVRIKQGSALRRFAITVAPLDSAETGDLALVSFEDQLEPKISSSAVQPEPLDETTIEWKLEEELRRTRAELRGAIEELQSLNQEMEASNEEMLAMNEELESANEELQASREELQSLNEELHTINSQLQKKVEEAEQSHDDLRNLIDSTRIATIFLDTQLRVKQFTPAVTKLVELIPSDIGRPITHLAQKFRNGDLIEAARTVLESLQPLQTEVLSDEGGWYVRKILPYRAGDNRIGGVTITFTDITELKRKQEEADNARVYAEAIVETVRQPLLVLDSDLRVQSANPAFYSHFKTSPGNTKGQRIFELGNRQWEIPRLRALLEEIIPFRKEFNAFEVTGEFENVGRRCMLLNARQLDNLAMILLAVEDVTEARRADAEKRSVQLQMFARELTHVEERERRRLARVLHDNLQQFLVAAITRLALIKKETRSKNLSSLQALSTSLEKAVEASRSLTAELSPPVLYEAGLVGALEWLAKWNEETHGFKVEVEVDPTTDLVDAPLRIVIFNAVRELLFNAVKHAGVDRARVEVAREGSWLRAKVEDSGKGFDSKKIETSEAPMRHFGLFNLQERLSLLGGQLEIDSAPGHGTRAVVRLPEEKLTSLDSHQRDDRE